MVACNHIIESTDGLTDAKWNGNGNVILGSFDVSFHLWHTFILIVHFICYIVCALYGKCLMALPGDNISHTHYPIHAKQITNLLVFVLMIYSGPLSSSKSRRHIHTHSTTCIIDGFSFPSSFLSFLWFSNHQCVNEPIPYMKYYYSFIEMIHFPLFRVYLYILNVITSHANGSVRMNANWRLSSSPYNMYAHGCEWTNEWNWNF